MLKEEGRKKYNTLGAVLVKNLEFIFLEGYRNLLSNSEEDRSVLTYASLLYTDALHGLDTIICIR